MKKRARKPLKKEEVAEDWCFVCKEGGDLLICDYRQCLKAYHVHCVGKKDSFLTSEESFKCNWHCCFICQNASSFQCHCCPKAVCRHCISSAEFVVVRGNHGFCCNCLKLALLVEEDKDVDSEGETVDFKDLKTYEGLFMDYYSQMIKGKKNFTLDDLRTAKQKLAEDKFESDEMESDYESEDVTEDSKPKRRKEIRSQLPVKKAKNVKSKKMEFTGWGSTALVEFLESIGQDTGKELHRRQVETLINTYVKEHKLFDPVKKRTILCDDKLQAIFGRKVVNRGRIYSMLEPHFVNNLEESETEEELEEEDEITFNSGAADEDILLPCKTRRKLKEEKDSPKHKPIRCVPQSCFAAITAENIKLVYLRRSLLQELSKDPESFENKVIGSFIRMKTDPHDYFQRNSHQLLQVTGVKRSSNAEKNAEMILLASNMPLEIRMSSLSDCDIEEAELVDLRQKVKDSVIPKLTVVELQQKARNLHEDITNHWIDRELKLLDLRIDQALEKGWRRDWFEYKEKRQQLQTQEERSRLLKTAPNVIVEELDRMIEEDVHNKKGNEASRQSVYPIDLSCKWGGNGTSIRKKYPGQTSSQDVKQNLRDTSLPLSPNQTWNGKTNKTIAATLEGSPDQVPASENQCKVRSEGNDEMRSSSITGMEQNQGIGSENTISKKQEPIVDKEVDLISDDESISRDALRKQNLEDPESRVWLILSPDGERKGKFSLSLLKNWSKRSPYALKYKAWKETETEEQAIWLGDAIKLAYNEK